MTEALLPGGTGRHLLLAVLALPLVTGALCLLVPARRTALVSGLGNAMTLILSGLVVLQVVRGFAPGGVGDRLVLDGLGATFLLLGSLVAFVAALNDATHAVAPAGPEDARRGRQAVALRHAVTFATFLAVSAADLGTMWVAMTAVVFGCALLAVVDGSAESIGTAWKYLLIGAVGILFALFGTVVLSVASVGLLSDAARLQWTALGPVADRLEPSLMRLSFVFVMVGYGTGAALAPMHGWMLDILATTTTPVRATLGVAASNVALYGLLRFYALMTACGEGPFASALLVGVAIVSVAISTVAVLVGRDRTHLLAYSGVQHLGIVALGVGFGGIHGLFGGLLHAMNQTVARCLLIVSSVIPGSDGSSGQTQSAASPALPGASFFLMAGGLAIAGVPPFGTFFSQFEVLLAGFSQGRFVTSGISLAALAGLAVAVVRYLVRSAPATSSQGWSDAAKRSRGPLCSLVVLAALAIATGLHVPDAISRLLYLAVEVLRG